MSKIRKNRFHSYVVAGALGGLIVALNCGTSQRKNDSLQDEVHFLREALKHMEALHQRQESLIAHLNEHLRSAKIPVQGAVGSAVGSCSAPVPPSVGAVGSQSANSNSSFHRGSPYVDIPQPPGAPYSRGVATAIPHPMQAHASMTPYPGYPSALPGSGVGSRTGGPDAYGGGPPHVGMGPDAGFYSQAQYRPASVSGTNGSVNAVSAGTGGIGSDKGQSSNVGQGPNMIMGQGQGPMLGTAKQHPTYPARGDFRAYAENEINVQEGDEESLMDQIALVET